METFPIGNDFILNLVSSTSFTEVANGGQGEFVPRSFSIGNDLIALDLFPSDPCPALPTRGQVWPQGLFFGSPVPPSPPPPTDPYFAYVVALISMDGSFTDSSSYHRALTPVGTTPPVISTAQSKFSGSSGFFAGTSGNGSLNLDETDGTLLMTGDFTIEMWVYRTDATWAGIVYSTGGFGNYQFTINGTAFSPSDGGLALYLDGVSASSAPGVVPLDTWTFISYTRSGSTIWCHADGVQVFSLTSSATIQVLRLGSTQYRDSYIGYMDEARITNGIARYGAGSYAVPTAPFPTS